MYKVGEYVLVIKKDEEYIGIIREVSSYEDNWYLIENSQPSRDESPTWISEDKLSVIKN